MMNIIYFNSAWTNDNTHRSRYFSRMNQLQLPKHTALAHAARPEAKRRASEHAHGSHPLVRRKRYVSKSYILLDKPAVNLSRARHISGMNWSAWLMQWKWQWGHYCFAG